MPCVGRWARAGRTNRNGGKPMKIHEAIAYFEDAIRESDEIIAECSEATSSYGQNLKIGSTKYNAIWMR